MGTPMMQKQSIVTAISAAALLFAAPVLSSCSADHTPPVMLYEKTEVTEAMYTYWMSGYKSYFLSLLGGEDTEEFLNTVIQIPNAAGGSDSVSVADYLSDRIEEIIENNCISLHLFDAYGLELPASTVSAVNEAVASEIENAGGRKALNQTLSQICLNADSLREMYLCDEKISYVYDYLYGNTTLGTTGAEPISTEQYNDYYEKNYVCVRHIYIRTADKNVLDENGDVQYESDGSVVTAALTEEEAAQKFALCDELMARLDAGEDFITLENEYSEDSGRYTLKNGYIISRSTPLPDEFVNQAFDMEIGEIARVDASYATHIMLRTELPENGWADANYETMMSNFKELVKSEVYAEKIAPMIEKITVDEDLAKKHDIYNTPISSY